MTKRIKILMLVVMLIFTSTLTLIVNAADTSVDLNLGSAEVKAGDTFTVTLKAICEEGINGIEGNLSYDKNKLELSNLEVLDTLKWSVLNEEIAEGLNLGIMSNSSDTITSADILKLTFKVKDEVEVGTKLKVTLADITLGSDAATDSTKQIGTKEVEVTIIEELANENQGDNNNIPSAGDNELNNENNQGDNNNTPPTGDTEEKNNGTSNKAEDVTENDNKQDAKDEYKEIKEKDNTQTEDKMPHTGISNVIGIVIIIAIFAVVFFVKYNKYKEI